jgi:hypothetical protein
MYKDSNNKTMFLVILVVLLLLSYFAIFPRPLAFIPFMLIFFMIMVYEEHRDLNLRPWKFWFMESFLSLYMITIFTILIQDRFY